MDKNNIKTLKSRLSKINIFQIAVFAIIAWFVWDTVLAINDNYKLQQRVEGLQSDIVNLELENDRLRFSNKFYESEDFLDLSVRKNLNKLLPGEKVIVVPSTDEKYAPITTVDVALDQEAEKSNIQVWLDYLFGLDI